MFPGVVIIDSLSWMILGALQILIIAGAYAWIQYLGKTIKVWQMAILYGIFVTFCITIGGGSTLVGEYETQGGMYFIGFLGVPIILAFAIAVKLFLFKAPVK